MEVILDEQMPRRRRRYLLVLWWITGLAILILSSKYIKTFNSDDAKVAINEKIEIPSVDEFKVEFNKSELADSAPLSLKNSEVLSETAEAKNSSAVSIESTTQDHISVSNNTFQTIITQPEHKLKNDVSQEYETPPTLNNTDESQFSDQTNNSPEQLKVSKLEEMKTVASAAFIPGLGIAQFPVSYSITQPSLATSTMSVLEPIMVSCCNKKVKLAAGIHGEYLTSFNSYGYGVNLAIQKPLNQKWYMSMTAAYTYNMRNITESGRIDAGAGGEFEDQNPDSGVVNGAFTGEPYKILSDNTDTLSSYSLGLNLGYNLSGRLSLFSGLMMSHYPKRLSLSEMPPDELAMTPIGNEAYVVGASPKWIPSAEFGISYRLVNKLHITGRYSYALESFYKVGEQASHTNKYYLGLNYQF